MLNSKDFKNEEWARSKAVKVARYYYAYLNMLGKRPTLRTIGERFGRSVAWAVVYLNLAWELELITVEDGG